MTAPTHRYRSLDSAAEGTGWKFLGSRRWIGYFALFLIFSIACVWLGNWQFDRRAEARAEIDRIDRNYDASPMLLEQTVPEIDSFDEDQWKWQPVKLVGEYRGEPFLARNRPGAHGVGSEILQELRLTDGRVFFIDRGWVPVNGAESSAAVLPDTPDGEVSVIARLRASEPEISGREPAGRTVPSIDVPMMADMAGLANAEVYSEVYGQLVSEQPAGETGTLAQRPERDEGPHLSYALQWYVFIGIAGVGLGYAARQEHRHLHDDEATEGPAPREAKPTRRRKRRPSDAEEEDALIDG